MAGRLLAPRSPSRLILFRTPRLTRPLSTDPWPDTRLGGLEPTPKLFPLPGLVGSPLVKKSSEKKPNYAADILTAELSYERQSSILEQFMTISRQLEAEQQLADGSVDEKPSVFDRFECAAYECPKFLFQDLCKIFPVYNSTHERVTVITLSQKAESKSSVKKDNEKSSAKISTLSSKVPAADASESNTLAESLTSSPVLSEQVPALQSAILSNTTLNVNHDGSQVGHEVNITGSKVTELNEDQVKVTGSGEADVRDESLLGSLDEEMRVKLMESFIESATDICEVLHEAGYWADFIDPSSGRPFISEELVSAVGYEADDRLRRSGFEIREVVGGCRVLQHHTWGSQAYVGCLFTSAPLEHPLLKGVVVSEQSVVSEQTVSESEESDNKVSAVE